MPSASGVSSISISLSAEISDINISAIRASAWSKGAYTRVTTSRNIKKSMKFILPERISFAPVRIVVATPKRMMTLAAFTKIPVESSPCIMVFS